MYFAEKRELESVVCTPLNPTKLVFGETIQTSPSFPINTNLHIASAPPPFSKGVTQQEEREKESKTPISKGMHSPRRESCVETPANYLPPLPPSAPFPPTVVAHRVEHNQREGQRVYRVRIGESGRILCVVLTGQCLMERREGQPDMQTDRKKYKRERGEKEREREKERETDRQAENI
ncbi:MAG TPA: hypothetical protein V6C97_32795 [Oculatellaceae cyanobacterium]